MEQVTEQLRMIGEVVASVEVTSRVDSREHGSAGRLMVAGSCSWKQGPTPSSMRWETKIDTLGTVLAATFTAQLATEIGAVRKEATRHFVTLIAALITLTAASLVGETVLPHCFPPPSLQVVQSRGE